MKFNSIKLSLGLSTILLGSSLFAIDNDVKIKSGLDKEIKRIDKRLSITENYIYYSNQLLDKEYGQQIIGKIENINLQMTKNKEKIKVILQSLDTPEIKKLLKRIDSMKKDTIELDVEKIKKEILDINKNKEEIKNLIKENKNLELELNKTKKDVLKELKETKTSLIKKMNQMENRNKKIEILLDKLLINKEVLNNLEEEKTYGSKNNEELIIKISNFQKELKEQKKEITNKTKEVKKITEELSKLTLNENIKIVDKNSKKINLLEEKINKSDSFIKNLEKKLTKTINKKVISYKTNEHQEPNNLINKKELELIKKEIELIKKEAGKKTKIKENDNKNMNISNGMMIKIKKIEELVSKMKVQNVEEKILFLTKKIEEIENLKIKNIQKWKEKEEKDEKVEILMKKIINQFKISLKSEEKNEKKINMLENEVKKIKENQKEKNSLNEKVTNLTKKIKDIEKIKKLEKQISQERKTTKEIIEILKTYQKRIMKLEERLNKQEELKKTSLLYRNKKILEKERKINEWK